MAIVQLKGTFMGVSIKTSEFDGVKKSKVVVDVYQQESESNEKTVQIQTDDIQLFEKINKDYQLGKPFSCEASVNAYKNKAYFKLQKIS